MTKYSVGRIFGGLGIALASALLLPLEMALVPWLVVVPLLGAFLFVWAGAIPALGLCAMTLLSARFWGGGLMTTAVLLGMILPMLAAMRMLRMRLPFFRAMLICVAAQIASMALALVYVRLATGQDLIAALTGWLRGRMESLPPLLLSEYLMLFVRARLLPASGLDLSQALLSAQDAARLLDSLLSTLDTGLRLNLPSLLLCSGAATGMLSHSLSALYCRVKGFEPPLNYVYLSNWRLPRQMIIGLPLSALAAYVALMLGMNGADSALMALLNLCVLAFTVQALGAMGRRMRALGIGSVRRNWMNALMLVFGQWLLAAMGVCSALFGSQGLVRLWIQRHNDNAGGDDWS